MKKEELLSIGLTEEQANQVFAMNGKDVENAKTKLKEEITSLKEQVSKANDTITTLEANKGDLEGLQAELEKYRQADEARQKAEQEAAAQKALEERFDVVVDGKEFANNLVRNGTLAEFSRALNDPANTGKGDKELFDALTKDASGIWKNPQQEQVVIRGVNHQGGTVYTADQIRKMTPDEINKNWADVSASLKGLN